jgi:hypothetical protein
MAYTRVRSGLLSLFMCCSACTSGSNGHETVDGDPAAHASPADAGATCRDQPRIDGLETIPWLASVAHYEKRTCIDDGASVLLVNSSGRTIHVERVGASHAKIQGPSSPSTSASFETTTVEELPRDIEPFHSLIVQVDFLTKMPGVSALAHLVVETDEGCQDVGGVLAGALLSENEGGIRAPGIVDFGVLRPGEARTVDIEFVTGGTAAAGTELYVNGTSAPDIFELVATLAKTLSEQCERITVSIRLTAPAMAGPVNADLFFETVSHGFSGVATVGLRALVEE